MCQHICTDGRVCTSRRIRYIANRIYIATHKDTGETIRLCLKHGRLAMYQKGPYDLQTVNETETDPRLPPQPRPIPRPNPEEDELIDKMAEGFIMTLMMMGMKELKPVFDLYKAETGIDIIAKDDDKLYPNFLRWIHKNKDRCSTQHFNGDNVIEILKHGYISHYAGNRL